MILQQTALISDAQKFIYAYIKKHGQWKNINTSSKINATLCYKIKKEGGIVGRTNKGKEKQKGLKLKTTVKVSKMYCLQK